MFAVIHTCNNCNRYDVCMLNIYIYVFTYFYMMKVIASLREQRKRNTPLLKMLSYNIVKYNIALDLKQCATLLYSMAILNFADKVCTSYYIDLYI